MNESWRSSISIRRTCRGRMLYAKPDGTLFLGRHNTVFRTNDDGHTWSRVTSIPCPLARRLAEPSRLASRALRHHVKAFVTLSDGTAVASTRDGVFHAEPGWPRMKPSRTPGEGLPSEPPMTISIGPGDRVLWGEYFSNRARREVRLYVSDDKARTFEVAHVFQPGEIRHLHNIYHDKSSDHYWILAGDHDGEPGIGRLSGDLTTFEWVVKGKQIHRAVCVFDFGDRLVYGTDTEKEPNAIMRLDKATGRVERIAETPGSSLYACRFGGLYAISTAIEPSEVNTSRAATLWLSRDGESWHRAFEVEKDVWHPTFFQFGTLVLPRGESDCEILAFSGQAVRGLDGKTVLATAAETSAGPRSESA